MRRTLRMEHALILLMIMMSGCFQNDSSSAGETGQTADKTDEPVTLKLRLIGAYVEVFHTYMDPLIQQKYPNMTIEYSDEKQPLPDVVASGNTPDIVMQNGSLRPVLDLNLQYDLNGLIKKYNFNLQKIDPSLVQSIKEYASHDELYGLPSDRSVKVLLYNKDLFDRFNVPYPKDGMSWDETIALAKRLTRTVDGVNYYGLNPAGNAYLRSQLQLHIFDKNGNVQLTTPEWQKAAAMWKAIYDIPGNYVSGNARDLFSKDRNTAMLVNNSVWLLRNPIPDFNWDYVTMPTFENGLVADWLGATFTIASTSKNKDAAFQVMDLYFSDEVQIAIARNAALVIASTSPEIQKQWGANIAGSAGKNVQADFRGKPAVKVVEQYDDIANPQINPAFADIAVGKADVNTALRQAEEKANQKVQEEKAK